MKTFYICLVYHIVKENFEKKIFGIYAIEKLQYKKWLKNRFHGSTKSKIKVQKSIAPKSYEIIFA